MRAGRQCWPRMRSEKRIGVVIPALNEESAIAEVISGLPQWTDVVVVADNGSTDLTAQRAREAGAIVVAEPERGYGAACLRAIANLPPVDVIVFIDGDLSDDGSEMNKLVDPIVAGDCDLVIGSRRLGEREPGALSPQQIFGNWLATTLIRLIWGAHFTDLGPFRAIKAESLRALDMRDRDFGWTVEMQIKAAQKGLRTREVPVRYRNRIGASKISGTVSGVVRAGTKILYVIGRSALRA